MRHLKNIMILVMTLTAITLTSCSSDDDGGGDSGAGGAGSGVLVAKVDGTNYQSMQISSSATLANAGQNLIIIASNSSGKAFSMQILGVYNGPGTYTIGGGINIANGATYTETDVDLNNPQNSTTEFWSAPFDDMVAGEIVITEETDTKVKGTFNFSCKNVGGDSSIKVITDGSFNLSKQVVN